VGEVVALLEGGKTLVNCDEAPEVCSRVDSCVTRYIWMEAATAMYERLAAITFADLLSMNTNGCQEKFIDYLTSAGNSSQKAK
jgi:DNA-binding IscR family transcriptional regulator